MGVRGELFSTKVSLQNRTYFFNVKENRLGDLYLNIVESKNRDEGGFDRQSVILFAEDLQVFLQGFDDALRVLEKAAREKRRGKKSPAGPKRDWDAGESEINMPDREFGKQSRDKDSDFNREGKKNYPSSGREGRRDFTKSEGPRRPRSSGYGEKSGGRSPRGGREAGPKRDWDSERKPRSSRTPAEFSGRKPRRDSLEFSGRTSRGSYENKDNDSRPRGKERAPAKKRVVVRKK